MAAVRWKRLWVPVALSCLLPVLVEAQEVGGLYSAGNSELLELGGTTGYGAYVRLAQHPSFNVRLSWERLRSRSSRIGRVCTLYAPLLSCNEESIASDTRIRRVAVTGAWRVLRYSFFELDAGAGASLNALRTAEETESGRWSGISVPLGENVAFHGELRSRVRPFADAPVVLEFAIEEQRLFLDACVSDALRYGPFCGTKGLRGIRFGIGYAFRS